MKVLERARKTELAELYRQMYRIRVFEEKCGELYARGLIRGFLHIYIGQEANAVGAMSVLRPEDYVVTHYRDHGQALARGLDAGRCMAELFGRATGVSRGKGGSMHLFDAQKNFVGGHAIVAGHFPLATGLALAAQYKREDRVVLTFFGDGAVNQGVFHETFNLAALWKLPIVFFLENNLYGMGSAIGRVRSGGADFQDAGKPYGIECVVIDGMDVMAVREATQAAVHHARSGKGPAFIESKTFRFHGHSMADPVKYRGDEEEERWKRRDPLHTFPRMLLELGLATDKDIEKIKAEAEAEIDAAIKFAEDSPWPAPEALYEDIYA
ncbi:MAG: pyruvate dehydrogenase (acetyl-transferring) E1 component subunit alpha [Chloroflexi bacterium]|nr:pyruvate dehydrogenase (acetyl-transferring) E1 component subunit alpha [Chloroflexota bacterium]